ncbi:YhaN family protein [Thiocystis violascens]|uniref:YhaN AAA domain-containing protein n=1 Tax=Thiocystis violascens (strain ATCC 17096 / DSM 198 / 6111) TaxID=765911 RepID=I3YHF4_THIV6|nr:YhaN family protein [Thiocystis violascens]AFL76422.1 hypothetical protein Thivi_4631 [Thiocystis violascens DSM 198]
MKILDLHLRAFGPFSDRHLDLSGGQQGLHLIFGPNEAGKSSALRALRALLFGIPERTQDDFLHARQNLRVGGRLQGHDGTELLCFRKKGRKHTLLDGDEKPLADDCLARLLGGVDERLFERLFGIDHEGLVAGGQALLAERGREAEALFGAGLGSVDLHAVLKQLDQEARDLFLPRASTRLINLQLSQLTDIERRQREVSLSARHWDDARKAVNQARQRLVEMDETLARTTRQHSRLERIRRTLPNLARRAQLLAQLAELGETPSLSEDFGQRRETALSQRALALASQSGALARFGDIQVKVAALTVREELLAEADAIDALRERLGSHRKAARDRSGLVSECAALESRSRALLAQARPDLCLTDAPGLRPLLNRRRRAAELGESREIRAAAVAQARTKLAETQRKLADVRDALAALPASQPLDGLRHAIDEARRAGDLERAAADALARIQGHDHDCQRELSALELWTKDLDALRHAPLPSAGTVERFANEFRDLEDAIRTLDRILAETRSERRRIEEALRALQLGGTIPSEGDLARARAQRDRGWRLLKRQWLGGAEILAEDARDEVADTALPAVFERDLATADEVADRLRREARRVHEQAAAHAQLESRGQRIGEAEQESVTLHERRDALLGAWQSLWRPCGLDPLPPREMQHWLVKATRLRELAGQGDELLAGLAQLRATSETHARALRSALRAVGFALPSPPEEPGPSLLLNQAEAHLASLLETERRRALLEKEMSALRDAELRLDLDVTASEEARASWSSAWAALMDELGLPQDASPGDASDHLKNLDDCLAHLRDAERLAARIAGIDADAMEFQQEAGGLLSRLAPDLKEQPIEEALPQLHRRLVKQREDKSRLDELMGQSQRTEEEIRQAEVTLRATDAILAELCREAGCKSPEQLTAVEQTAQAHHLLQKQLQDVDAALVSAGDGLGIDALLEEAGGVDRDAVLAELNALEARLDGELRPRQADLLEEKVNAERKFAEMTGDNAAAALAEEAQHTLSTLRYHAERYVRVKLAARILRDTIESFRREHRDPILTRASGYFAQLTCHAFNAVETDFDESDQPVLVGQRATGERLRVEGMSTGTRDQLYLALRLANLDHHLSDTEPLPFIVDDILIHFDDARAYATLAALADFSAKTQVVLFTHHRQVVEQARNLDTTGTRVLVHALSETASAS